MNEREGFLKLLAEDGDNTTVRLVYADWLDERGEHEEADRQRGWVAAREWLVRLCEANNPPADRPDPYGSFIPYEALLEIAREAIESGNHDGLWFACRNNRALSVAIRDNEAVFWKHATLVTGAVPAPPDPWASGGRPWHCSEC